MREEVSVILYFEHLTPLFLKEKGRSFSPLGRKEIKMKKSLKLSLMAMYAAISVLAILFIRIPLVPATPFLVYDMADIPIILATLTLGLPAGAVVLTAVCLIQAFLLGGDGLVGCVMHLVSTGAMIVIFATICHKKTSILRLVLSAVLATVAMTAVMIPMNLWLTVEFLGTPRQVVLDLLVPAIIPFNLIKAGLNSALSVVVFKLVRPILRRFGA